MKNTDKVLEAFLNINYIERLTTKRRNWKTISYYVYLPTTTL